MQIYPYTTPLILTEAIYTEYGGQTGSATYAQIQNAFLIAEQRVTKYVGTFLLPTTITGTFPYNRHQFIATDYGYVQEVLSASVFTINNLTTCALKSNSGCVFIFDDTFGYLNFSCACNYCNCAAYQYPYQFQIAYRAGLPTGTANQPPFEHALTIVAEEALNEMQFPRLNESAGARGVKQFNSLGYSENRKKLKRTALGQSARANYAAELIDSCVVKARKAIMMR